MLGAIAGDIIGSVYEFNNIKTKQFELFAPGSRFTDDSVLTIALADAILSDKRYDEVMKAYHARYPDCGYGRSFARWAYAADSAPYNSWGNGSAMRTSPAGYAFDTLEETLSKAAHFAAFTHNHAEGIRGAQSVSAAIFMARQGASKADISAYTEREFSYDLSRSIDEIRPSYQFDVSCQGSVPQAITAFLESSDFEDAIRNAISIGGDSDTIACICGGIAEAFYGGVPEDIRSEVLNRLDAELINVVDAFYTRYISS